MKTSSRLDAQKKKRGNVDKGVVRCFTAFRFMKNLTMGKKASIECIVMIGVASIVTLGYLPLGIESGGNGKLKPRGIE